MRDSSDMPTIGDLINDALRNGRTVRQLEADSGDRVKFQTFQTLANHPPKQFPKDPKTIAGLADALRVSKTAVVLAYAQGLGIEVSAGSTFALRLPPGVDSLAPEMQTAIINVARAALRTAPVTRSKTVRQPSLRDLMADRREQRDDRGHDAG